MTDNLNAVFVYGTLRPSKVSTHVLHAHKMYDYGKFPYLVAHVGAATVKGNIIHVTDKQLKQLDKYEGVDRGLYSRETVTVYDSATTKPEKCFVYVATDRLHPKRISSGDWFKR